MSEQPTIDLSKLSSGPTGRQNDADVPGGVSEFEFVRLVPIVIVQRKGHPEEGEFALDPVNLLARREFEAHPKVLISGRFDGHFYVTDEASAEEFLVALARRNAASLIDDALQWLGQVLGAHGVPDMPQILRMLLGKLLGLS